jgi:hypothetical protein
MSQEMHRLDVPRSVLLGLALGLFVVIASVPAGTQGTPDVAVVVHSEVPVDNLSMADLRKVVLGDREFWPGGVRITLLIRAPIAHERDVAVKDISQMTEAQFRAHWIGKVFRAETPSGPKITYSREAALAQLSRTPGAIALVETPITTAGVKVLKIDGKSPGQPGYPLK